jgi:hypothetical protein
VRRPLDASLLRASLRPPWHHLEVIASAGAGEAIDGVVLIAENPTAGRGRQDRTWSGVPRALGDYVCASPVSAAVSARSLRGVRRSLQSAFRHGRLGPFAVGYAVRAESAVRR